MNTGSEAWEPVDGWPGYELDRSAGIVRSVDRTVIDGRGVPRRLSGCVLVQVPDVRGFPQVTLSQGGRRRVVRVETLLREAGATAAKQSVTVRKVDTQ